MTRTLHEFDKSTSRHKQRKTMSHADFPDPFHASRTDKGYGHMDDQNDPVTMLLRLKDIRKTAKNWETFQSAAKPGRIVVPSEVSIRETRQIPFEVDPPMHTKYRALVEGWFKRPDEPAYIRRLESVINELFDEVLQQHEVEVVEEFALKLQSRALTLLLNIPYKESEVWISWGKHVFRSENSPVDADKAAILYGLHR